MRVTIPSILFGIVVLGSIAGDVTAQRQGPYGKDALDVARSNNQFTLDLYGQLRQEKGNLFFSPYSISSALAMTYAGARGETATAMANTLHFSLPQNRFHPAMGELVHRFNAQAKDRPYQLRVATALWGQKGFTFLPDFLKLTQDQYEAALKEVDFANNTEQARRTINAWVERQTQDKIKDLIQKGVLHGDTRLVLTNAIYFKAPWQDEFHKPMTKEEPFTLADGSKTRAPLMHKSEKLQYVAGEDFQAVAIPYKSRALSMIVLLPRKADGLPDLEKSLTVDRLEQWLKQMEEYQVDLKLPRFKVTAQFSLKDQLSRMGMGVAFSNKADFSGMSSEANLKIDAVIHKAYVDVNEKGTEAAAATAVAIGLTSAPQIPEKRANFHADRPFLFLIRENQTGSILVAGRLVNPGN